MRTIILSMVVVVLMLQASIKTIIVSYYHLNKDFIATTLCVNKDKASMKCNGKCYLSKKIKEQETKENKLASLLKEIRDANGCLSEKELYTYSPTGYFLSSQKSKYLEISYSSPFGEILQPPC